MNMKKYIKPTVEETLIQALPLLNSNSVKTVEALSDVTVSEEEFQGGTVDSRRRTVWDDEEQEW